MGGLRCAHTTGRRQAARARTRIRPGVRRLTAHRGPRRLAAAIYSGLSAELTSKELKRESIP